MEGEEIFDQGEKRDERERERENDLRTVGADDVTDGSTADGAKSLSSLISSATVEGDGAAVTEAHVTARIEDAVDAVLVADGALTAGALIEIVRQRLHVG